MATCSACRLPSFETAAQKGGLLRMMSEFFSSTPTALPAPAFLRNIEAIGPLVQRRNRLRPRQRFRDRLEQRLDAEIDERPKNLIVMGGHEDAGPELLDKFERDRRLHLRDRMALISHDGDIDGA